MSVPFFIISWERRVDGFPSGLYTPEGFSRIERKVETVAMNSRNKSVRREAGGVRPTGARVPAALLAICGLFLLTGCRATSITAGFDPEADLSLIKKVAVIPFRNYSRDRFAGEKVSEIFTSALIESNRLKVVEPGEVEAALRSAGAEVEKLAAKDLRKIGKQLGVQALILGSVGEYQFDRIEKDLYPVVSVTARMVDVETGTVLWHCNGSGSGAPRTPIVNVGVVRILPKLAKKITRQMIETLGPL